MPILNICLKTIIVNFFQERNVNFDIFSIEASFHAYLDLEEYQLEFEAHADFTLHDFKNKTENVTDIVVS